MLVTVVSYCTRERAYIDAIVRNARVFSDLVVVSMGSHLYTGEPEPVADEAARLVSDADPELGCEVLVTVYDVEPGSLTDPVRLHNRAREAGVHAVRSRVPHGAPWWCLLLDGDEVPSGLAFAAWWRAHEDGVDARCVYKMANRWAFLHPRLVADQLEDSVMLVHSNVLLNPYVQPLNHPRERDGIYLAHLSGSPLGMPGLSVQRFVGRDAPMFWHFSWVRGDPEWIRSEAAAPGLPGDASTGLPHPGAGAGAGAADARAALKLKVRNWGHRDDRDWDALIDAAFDALELGAWPTHDFVHGYPLRVLDRVDCIV